MSRKLALCIGISEYGEYGTPVPGAVNDAVDWCSVLQQRGFASRLLTDRDATRPAILRHMRDLVAVAEPNDLVVITFAGHGSQIPDRNGDEPDGCDECWCPHGVGEQGWITDDEINDVSTGRREGVRWIVISDSCHSGTVTRRRSGRPRFLPHVRFFREGLVIPVDPPRQPQSGPLLLAACQDHQWAWDLRSGENGVFTYHALRALSNIHAHSSYYHWMQLCRRSMKPEERALQTPRLSGKDSSWVVFATG